MWVMGEWAVGHRIVGVMSFQKMYCLMESILWTDGQGKIVLLSLCM